MYFLELGNLIDKDWLIQGITKLLAMIAVLQLIKKLPELINTIFGTNIKFQGGVKGRLGEMAGIGGIAQKAWTSLGNGAKNLAKLGLQAPIAAGYLAADSMYHKKTGERLKNSTAFRKGKGFLYGARSAVKSGSLLDAYQNYEKASAPIPLSKSDAQFVSDKARTSLRNAGIQNGYYDNSSGVHASGFKDETDHDRDVASILSDSKGTLTSKQGRKMYDNLVSLDRASKQANLAEGIQLSKQKIVDNFLSKLDSQMDGSQYTEAERAKVRGIISSFKDGDGRITEDGANILKSYMSSVDADNFKKAVVKNDKNVMEYSERYGVSENDLRSSIKLGDIVKNAQATVEQIKSDGTRIKDDVNTTEAEKILYDEYSGAISMIRGKTWGAVQNSDTSLVSDKLSWSREDSYAWSGTASDTEEGMVRRVNELRTKRNSASGLTEKEIEELKYRVDKIKQMQRDRRNNNNN